MRKFLSFTLATMLTFSFGSCSKTELDNLVEIPPKPEPEAVTFSIDYSFYNTESNPMLVTKNASDYSQEVYKRFYKKYIETRILTPKSYEISFYTMDNTLVATQSGRWDNNELFTLHAGEYRVSGYSTPSIDKITPWGCDTLYISISDTITITPDMTNYRLKAKNNCFMLFAESKNIKESSVESFSTAGNPYYENLRIADDIAYTFIYTIANNLTCKITTNDNKTTRFPISASIYQHGYYYFFRQVNGDFIIPELKPNL